MPNVNKGIIAAIAGAALLATASFTARFEGFKNTVYTDPVGHKAVCLGRDSYAPDGTPLRTGQTFTDDQCSEMFAKDLKSAGNAVDASVKVKLSDGERIAYTDFVFNVGAGAFRGSTALRKLNAGDRDGACAELLRWDKGRINGELVSLPGLTARRKAEYQQCMNR